MQPQQAGRAARYWQFAPVDRGHRSRGLTSRLRRAAEAVASPPVRRSQAASVRSTLTSSIDRRGYG